MTVVDYKTVFIKLAEEVGLDPYSTKYCCNRINSEGLSFLTKTLPTLSKSVLASLEKGYFERPLGFAYKGCSLRHFRSLLGQIFDQRTGKVLENVSPGALARIRQLCEYFYKLALPFSDDVLASFESKFVAEDEELAVFQPEKAYIDQLRKDFETYYAEISRATVDDVFSHHRPRPGSGTFSSHKDFPVAWYLRRESDVSAPKNMKAFSGYYKPYPSAPVKVTLAEDVDYSEVLFVPKDSRGPRTIVREPYSTLKTQLGFHDWLKGELERVTQNRVNFVDQQINRDLARCSSKTRHLSTLDLQSASDRVTASIMQRIFLNSPACRRFLADRTRFAKLPSGKFVQLNKVAGMGSGLTFPLMSLLITLTITRHVCNRTGSPYRRVMRQVYVYGDDIIVPTVYYNLAIEALGFVNLKVNTGKSYANSYFRESCGGDFYNGQDVAPVRLKLTHSGARAIPSGTHLQLNDDQWLLDVVSHAKELVKAGMYVLADFWYRVAEKRTGPLPAISGESPVLGRWQEEVPVHATDETGAYKKVRVVLAVPVKRTVEDEVDPYIYLGNRFKSKVAPRPDDGLKVLRGSTFGVVSVPRRVRFVTRSVSGFRLCG